MAGYPTSPPLLHRQRGATKGELVPVHGGYRKQEFQVRQGASLRARRAPQPRGLGFLRAQPPAVPRAGVIRIRVSPRRTRQIMATIIWASSNRENQSWIHEIQFLIAPNQFCFWQIQSWNGRDRISR